MLPGDTPSGSHLCYVYAMQPKPNTTMKHSADARTKRSRKPGLPLSVIHADALYKPVPPVSLDEEGYICGDGRVSESTRHSRWLNYAVNAAGVLLEHLPNALVAYDLAVLFEEGNPRALVSPDVVVSLDAGRQDRGSYKLWKEPGPPDLVLEALSERTWRRDLRIKPRLFEDLGVREYWIIDPIEKLAEPIMGRRLRDRRYEPIPKALTGGWISDVLGAELLIDSGEFRLRDLKASQPVPDFKGLTRLHAEAEQARSEAERGRIEAERRIADLEAELRDRQR